MNKRLFTRKALNTKIFFEDEFGEAFFWLKSRDISIGGIFVEGVIPIRLGSKVFLSFDVKDKKISVTGEVVRIPGEGMGIRFVGVRKDSAEVIKSFVSC